MSISIDLGGFLERGGGFGGLRGEAGRRRPFFDDFGSRSGGILEPIGSPGDAMCPQVVHFWGHRRQF